MARDKRDDPHREEQDRSGVPGGQWQQPPRRPERRGQVEKPDEEGPEQEPVEGAPEEPTENGPDEAGDDVPDP
jgi:hypothetical protein